MASRPPTIDKTTMFWSSTLWSWRQNAGARELSANHMLQSMTTTCRMAKSYRQKHQNYIQIEAIHHQSYCQLIHEGIKIPGGYNSTWNSAPFFLQIPGPLNCTFTEITIQIRRLAPYGIGHPVILYFIWQKVGIKFELSKFKINLEFDNSTSWTPIQNRLSDSAWEDE